MSILLAYASRHGATHGIVEQIGICSLKAISVTGQRSRSGSNRSLLSSPRSEADRRPSTMTAVWILRNVRIERRTAQRRTKVPGVLQHGCGQSGIRRWLI